MKVKNIIQTTIAAIMLLTAWACEETQSIASLQEAPVAITATTAGFATRAPADIKTAFYPGDEITLSYSTDGGTTYSTPTTATLAADGTWLTTLELPLEGTITLTARYGDTGPDPLRATATTTNGGITLGADPATGRPRWNITLNFTHTRAVVDVILFDPDMNNITHLMESVKINNTTSTTPTDILMPTDDPITAVTVTAAGITYTVTGLSHTLKAGTRHTLAFICDPVAPTVTLTTGPTWGEGSETTVPAGYDYVITDLADLKAWNTAMQNPDNLAKKAIQMADITWDADTDGTWTPVVSINGVYNGNGYTITGLKIGTIEGGHGTIYSGMFGYVSQAVLVGIHLRDANINDDATQTGLLVGETGNTTISLCSTQGTINNKATDVGGLVGCTYSDTHITRSYADVTITGTPGNSGGGLVGNNYNSTIVACGANANISFASSYYRAGCLVGSNSGNNATIQYCYATGTVNIDGTGTSLYVGGLVGENINSTTIAHCYATANATGADGRTGSLVGYNSDSGGITSCHATGTATDDRYVGNDDVANTAVATTSAGTRYTTVAPNFILDIRTVNYNATTGYDALNVDPAGVIFNGVNVWIKEEYPNINYLTYNGQ